MKLRSLLVLLAILMHQAIVPDRACACETTTITFTGNLDSRTATGSDPPIAPPSSSNVEEQIEAAQLVKTVRFFDSLGHPHTGAVAFYRLSAPYRWAARLIITDVTFDTNVNGTRSSGDTDMFFDENGNRRAEGSYVITGYYWPDGASNERVDLDFQPTSRPVAMDIDISQNGGAQGCPQRGTLDFDGDGRDDFAIWRPEFGMWAVLKSSVRGSDLIYKQWGLPGDYPIPGDYTGDGKADLVLFRAGAALWFVCKSELNYDCAQPQVVQFGLPGDIPVRGDYDGDGVLDFAVYRLSTGTFFYRNHRYEEIYQRQWGLPGDIPLQAVINQRPR